MKKQKKKKWMSILLAVSLFCSLGILPVQAAATKQGGGFIRVQGDQLVDEQGFPFHIRGIAFGNGVWANPSQPFRTHHTEESYRDLAELGFNTIRFYLNYGLFEDDSAPYLYKQSGWDWLDENIEYARKYGLRLILNMHVPQGGYQSSGEGMALWTDPENQNRLTALWAEIARRYQDEPVVLGFGLVNEPVVPKLDTFEKTLAQWSGLAQRITDAIRKTGSEQIIFVERLCAQKDLETGESDWSQQENLGFFLLDDDNTVYEFHNYDPYYFTHQDLPGSDTEGRTAVYPDLSRLQALNQRWVTATFGTPADPAATGWQEYIGEKFLVDDPEIIIANATLQAANMGVSGKAYIDEVRVWEYDENGEFLREIAVNSFDQKQEPSFWSSDGSGYAAYTEQGYQGGAVMAAGTTGDGNISCTDIFRVVQGHSYQVRAWIKTENLASDASVRPRVDFSSADSVEIFDRKAMLFGLAEFLSFGKQHHVPMYLGEFGADTRAFLEDRGGERWVADMLDLCIQNQIHFNYHTYHEEWFGLYQNSTSLLPDERNDLLWTCFQEKLQTQ